MAEHGARFSGRTVLVTGGGHGIGAATAVRLAQEGARVVVSDLDRATANAVRDALPGEEQHEALAMDLTDPASIDAAGRVLAGGPPLSVLAHTAGGATASASFEETTDAMWLELLQLNLLGVARTARMALPLMRLAQGDRAMVFVSSVNALHALGGVAYSGAKAALGSLTVQLASDLAGEGIRVNTVAPGTIRTRVWDSQPGGADRLAGLYPLGRVGEPSDIAAAIAFLASPDASWLTGQVLPVDGGLAVARPEVTR